MAGTPVEIGPWKGGLRNVPGFGEFIDDDQAYLLQNFEVDIDGSLANRPSIRRSTISAFGSANTNNMRLIGTFITTSERYLLVAATSAAVHLIEPASSTVVFTHSMTKPRACVSYNGTLYVVPTVDGEGGAVVVTGLSYSWSARSSMPVGTSAVIYKSRMFIGQDTLSKIRYSDINDFSSWPGVNNVGIGWENKQHLKAMVVIGSDIYLFKTDSTYRYGYANAPAQAELRIIDNVVGTIDETTVAVYNNNTIYTLSGNSVYELYQNTFTRISDDLDMTRKTDPTLLVNYGVSVFRDRLFVRFYSHMYVLSMLTQRWSEWTTARPFATCTYLPGDEPNDAKAYMASIKDTAGVKFVYYMQDDRILGVSDNSPNAENKEAFTCKLITKSFDFATPTFYKTILMGGLSVACSSPVTIKAVVPGSATIETLTWGEAFVQYTWGSAYDLGVTWGTENSSDGDIITQQVIPPKDGAPFGRKLIKCLGKFRYRQVQFVIEIPATQNTTASFAVRLFNLTVYALQKETVVKSITP